MSSIYTLLIGMAVELIWRAYDINFRGVSIKISSNDPDLVKLEEHETDIKLRSKETMFWSLKTWTISVSQL